MLSCEDSCEPLSYERLLLLLGKRILVPAADQVPFAAIRSAARRGHMHTLTAPRTAHAPPPSPHRTRELSPSGERET